MKTKPTFALLTMIILFAGLVLLVRCKTAMKPNSGEITQFLNKFNNSIKEGNTDTLAACFQPNAKIRQVKRFINLLAGKADKNGNKRLATLTLDVDHATINPGDNGLIMATIPVVFSHEALESKASVLVLGLVKTAPGQLQIVQVETRKFLSNYVAYENYVKSKTGAQGVFSAITIAAFKTAKQLKTRYDSVIWFDHVNGKTFFYVVKGNWNMYKLDSLQDKGYDPKYAMGLVSPELKEIIPTEFDLVHNVSGTIEGLIEVEKKDKKGFYNLDGKLVVPADYDQVFPLTENDNSALLRKGDDYFYLTKDLVITNKIAGFKITDALPKIKTYGSSYTLSDSTSKNLMEYNADDEFTSIVIPPSYLVDLQILPKYIDFQNPLRHPSADDEGDGEGSESMDVEYHGANPAAGNWFESIYYSVIDDYLGARSGLYETKQVLLVDKRDERIFGYKANSYYGNAEGGSPISGRCNENYLREINDTLFEYKTTSSLAQHLLDGEDLNEGPYFHYLHFVNGKLTALPCDRIFSCTKFVKLDDSYLQGCYVIGEKPVDHMTPEILSYMKNEIFASYGYKFKDDKWNEVFGGRFNRDTLKSNVDDSLTVIEKYNVSWINQKLKETSVKPNALAVK